jgi:hypothetical protein
METGSVSYAVYLYYVANMGLVLFGASILFYTVSQAFNSLSSIWLSKWSDVTDNKDQPVKRLLGSILQNSVQQ